METAVAKEFYERAAELRDAINRLKAKRRHGQDREPNRGLTRIDRILVCIKAAYDARKVVVWLFGLVS